jgi:hypothetical protein
MPGKSKVTLVGGPGDGETFSFADDANVLIWVPCDEREQVLCRMHDRPEPTKDPIEYRRSRRTRTLFVYQP